MTSERVLRVTAPGRAGIIGNPADMYGGAVLACSVPLRAWVELSPASELDNVGFNLYRSEAADGPYVQLNTTLIPPQNPGSVLGSVYEWLDADVQPGVVYFYKLEDLDVKGVSTFHGPVSSVILSAPAAVGLRSLSARGLLLPLAVGWVVTLGVAVARRRKRNN